MKLTLVTPEKKVAQDLEVERVILPGFNGELTVLPGHAPLVTTLGTGIVSFKPVGQSEFTKVAVSSGYCEVFPEGIQILAETAETKESIDQARAVASLKHSNTKLLQKGLSPEQIEEEQAKAKRARARLQLLGVKADDKTLH